MRGSISNFVPYTRYAIEFLFASAPPFWIITAVLGASLVAATVRQRPFSKHPWKRTYWVPLLQFLCCPATIAVAAVGTVDWTREPFPGINHPALYTNDALFCLSLICGVFWTIKMRGLRWFAGSLSLLLLWMLYAAGFIAAMALTGTWL